MSLRMATKEQVLALVEIIPESGELTLDMIYRATLDKDAQAEILVALQDYGEAFFIGKWNEREAKFQLDDVLYSPYIKENSKFELHESIMSALDAHIFGIENGLDPKDVLDPDGVALKNKFIQEKNEIEQEQATGIATGLITFIIGTIAFFALLTFLF